ncbi:MAG TPA: DNA/RNA helicase domain-containing protein, partial [Polyangiaceae bacterium]|nr:DNA/RNA helicase domain-containing protein [Polyangiaceae bacterium]
MARLIPPSVRRSEITLWARLAELDGDFVVRRMEAGEHGEVVVNIERRNRSLRLVPVALSGETRAADIGPLAETLARTLPTRISAASDGANTFSLATPTATLVLVSGASRPLVTELESLLHERLGFDVCAEPELLVRVVSLLADEPEHASGSSQAPKAQLYALPGASSGRRATPKPRDQAARFAQIDLEPEQVEAASVDLGTFLPAEQAATARQFRVRLVTGVAGSGKTLIAKYRARLLAAAFPHDTVLFLCNNTPLAATIRAELAREVPSARVQVKTFSSWAWQHHRRACNRHPLAKLSERKAIVQDLRRDVGVPDRITTK